MSWYGDTDVVPYDILQLIINRNLACYKQIQTTIKQKAKKIWGYEKNKEKSNKTKEFWKNRFDEILEEQKKKHEVKYLSSHSKN
jgi:gas vesicle protein